MNPHLTLSICRRFLGSPWWVTTGVACWCGPWLSISLRESGTHTHTHTQYCVHTVYSVLLSRVQGGGVPEHASVPRGPVSQSFTEAQGRSHL